MASSTVEDYLKAIYTLQREDPGGEATVVRLAAALGVTKGTVTTMVRRLRERGLADAERYGGITLTHAGRELAIGMVRRHRILETFLVETLGLDWSEVHAEAERLEHAMSDRVLERLSAFLGDPELDPHGDPIPSADGRVAEGATRPLSSLGVGDRARVARVDDADPRLLESLAAGGLVPGVRFRVVSASREAVVVKPRRRAELTLTAAEAGGVHADGVDP